MFTNTGKNQGTISGKFVFFSKFSPFFPLKMGELFAHFEKKKKMEKYIKFPSFSHNFSQCRPYGRRKILGKPIKCIFEHSKK